jgi:hypothetical protein
VKQLLLLFSLIALLGAGNLCAQFTIKTGIVGDADNHLVDWNTRPGFLYRVEMSVDLQNWIDTSIVEPGTGGTITYGFMAPEEQKLFYRIQEVTDPNNESFLLLPSPGQEMDRVDGVCFAFNLDVFNVPADEIEVRISQREFNVGAQWQLYGSLTDFDTLDNIRTLRGSAVWVPDDIGDYEVQAVALDDSGNIIGIAERLVMVGTNDPPDITIDNGPPNQSLTPELVDFDLTIIDDDPVRRVEFLDNGVLIGSDITDPFGDSITDLAGNTDFQLLRGRHNLTIKAFDSRAGIGELDNPYTVQITGGDAAPKITVSPLPNGGVVSPGQSFTLNYAVTDADGPNSTEIASVTVEDIASEDTFTDTSAAFTSLTINTTGWEPGSHTLAIHATDTNGNESYRASVTALVQGNSSMTYADQLLANVSDGLTAIPSGIPTYTGPEAASGFFSSGMNAGLKIDSGILLTTGSFTLWNGGDIEDFTDENLDPNFEDRLEPGDDDLQKRTSGKKTYDATALEFDLFCAESQLELVYQFGSEEYDDFVGFFNDGFIVTVDDVIVSLLPDCSDIIAVNSVSREEDFDSNDHLYLDDDDDIKPNVQMGSSQVEYDGMTVRLRIHAFVTPGLHKLKIVIADVDGNGDDDDEKDHFYDSGLFFENGSLRTVNPNSQ